MKIRIPREGETAYRSPHRTYCLADGAQVPSVTQVISRFKEAGALVHWAWRCGVAGKDYRRERDTAADAGTMAHAAVEAWIKKADYALEGGPEVVDKAKRAFGAFCRWAEQTQLEVTHTELSLVSERYRFGGTIDAVTIQHGRAVADWKTSQRLYPEYLVQIAAYGRLWGENYPR
jgi:hypothetical protein